MAQGDITFFEEAKAYIQDGGWEPSDDIKVAVLDNTTTPTAADATPGLGDYTEVGSAGTYVAGGISIGTWGALITEAGGVAVADSGTNPSWAKDPSNDTDAHWALIYNATQAGDPAIAFVDLAGPINMVTGNLDVTWHASGIYDLT